MIIRNSIKSILRMPVRSVFFTLLIVAVTAFLYLGVNTFASSAAMLAQCDRDYTTIVTFEYLGENYPDESVYDETMLSDVAATDFDAIANDPNTLLWQVSDCTVGVIEGFTAHSSLVPYRAYCVLVVSGISLYETDGRYYGLVEDSLYAYRTEMQGRHVFISCDGFGVTPDPDKLYIVRGFIEDMSSGIPTVRLAPFSSYSALLAGIDCGAIDPFVETPSLEYARESVYADIAEYYRVMNNKVYVYGTPDVEVLEEFHQSEVALTAGRFFTPDEYASDAKVCILTETIASRAGLDVGDSFELTSFDNTGLPAADCIWPGNSHATVETYTVVGIVNYSDGLQYNVYIPRTVKSAVPERYIYRLGQATIKNGTADAFVNSTAPLLSPRVTVNVYDEGYQVVADSLSVIRTASAALSAVALAASVAVLLFFAYLFIEKQRNTAETMRCFGATKAETRLYLLFGAGLIALVAVGVGVFLGTRYAGMIIDNAYSFVSELQAVDTRYSSAYLGVMREFTPIPMASVPIALATGFSVFALSLFFSLHYAKYTIDGRVMQARERSHEHRPPRRASLWRGGALRYPLISIRRSGARSLVVPALSLVMTLFVSTLIATAASYTAARETLYDTTVLNGYFTTMGGKYAGNLLIKPGYAQTVIDSGFIENTAVTYHARYQYLGVCKRAQGAPGDALPVPAPDNSYRLEALMNSLSIAPFIVFTNSVSKAPEFYFSGFSARYLDGYSEASFALNSWTEPVCMVSNEFMAEHGIALGDTVRVYVANTVRTPFPAPPFLGVELKVVGSFFRKAGENNIYCPLPASALDTDGISSGEETSDYRILRYGNYISQLLRSYGDGFAFEKLSPQETLGLLLDNAYVASMSFTLKDARELSSFKDMLEAKGFSGPRQEKNIRCALLVEDAGFTESLSAIAQRSKYLDMLYPILIALVCAVGFIASFLMMNSRREEIAVMRGLGTRKSRIFFSFFAEQLVLLALGFGAGALTLRLTGGALPWKIDIYAFLICYCAGSALALIIHIRKSALSILSEKE